MVSGPKHNDHSLGIPLPYVPVPSASIGLSSFGGKDISILMQLVGVLVMLYGISTLVGYLMPNHYYTDAYTSIMMS